VQGRLVAGYGVAADGAHNDGINIAAPRGAPVEAADSGVVHGKHRGLKRTILRRLEPGGQEGLIERHRSAQLLNGDFEPIHCALHDVSPWVRGGSAPGEKAFWRVEVSALCHICFVKRQARLFALVEYLRGRRTGVTAEALAERFGTTPRTIYRDLDTLREAALPLKAERGRGGGYALDRSYVLGPVNFTAREAAVLLTVGRWATEMRLMPFADTLQASLDKVRGALTTSVQRDLLGHMASLTFVGVPAHAAPAGVRAAVEQAWFERSGLRIWYRDAQNQVTQRVVHVDGVVMERSTTYLSCDTAAPQLKRTFRLDRIEKAEVEKAGS